jgi:hypothetical protein
MTMPEKCDGIEVEIGATQPDGPTVTALKKRALWAVLGGAAVAEVTAASFARPFTWLADCVVSIAIGGLLAIVVTQRLAHPLPLGVARQRRPTSPSGENRLSGRRWAFWMGTITAAIAWELYSYAASPRGAHPTVSSMLDAFDTSHLGRAIAFAGWLTLGWYVATR